MPGPVNLNPAPRVDGWWRRLGALVCRPRCLACGEAAPPGADLCRACRDALPWNAPACPCCALPLPASLSLLLSLSLSVTMPGSGPASASGSAAAPDPGPTAGSHWGSGPRPGAEPHCGDCQRRPPPLHAAQAALRYAAPVDRLLPRFKFHRDLAAGRLLAELMAARFATLPRPDALLPVPLHHGRLRRRGYDQALELARPLARALDLPLLPGALRRVRATRPQSELDAAARARNLRGAFAVDAHAALPGHVVLVDDVMTTGATLYAAARALRRAGVARVEAWVCARVP